MRNPNKIFMTCLAGAGLLFYLSGCVRGPILQTAWDRKAGLAGRKTFNWATADQPKTGDLKIDDPAFDAQVRKAIEAAFVAKGYSKRVSGVPDLSLKYYAAVENEFKFAGARDPFYNIPTVRPDGTISFDAMPGGARYFAPFYERGTLVLDLEDPKTRKVLWRGTVRGAVDSFASNGERDKKIQNAIDELFSAFPQVKA